MSVSFFKESLGMREDAYSRAGFGGTLCDMSGPGDVMADDESKYFKRLILFQ